jgi:hypothetical protein
VQYVRAEGLKSIGFVYSIEHVFTRGKSSENPLPTTAAACDGW